MSAVLSENRSFKAYLQPGDQIYIVDTRELYLRWCAGQFHPLDFLVTYHDLVAMALCTDDVSELWSLMDYTEERNMPVNVLNAADDMFRHFRDHINAVYIPRLPPVDKGDLTPFKVTTHEAFLKQYR